MTVREIIHEMIAQETGTTTDSVSDEQTFYDLGADSLDVIEILLRIEEEFNLEIPETISQEFEKVGDIVQYVEEETIR